MPSNNVSAVPAPSCSFSPSLPPKLKLMTLARTQTANGNGRRRKRSNEEQLPHKTPKECRIGEKANSFCHFPAFHGFRQILRWRINIWTRVCHASRDSVLDINLGNHAQTTRCFMLIAQCHIFSRLLCMLSVDFKFLHRYECTYCCVTKLKEGT